MKKFVIFDESGSKLFDGNSIEELVSDIVTHQSYLVKSPVKMVTINFGSEITASVISDETHTLSVEVPPFTVIEWAGRITLGYAYDEIQIQDIICKRLAPVKGDVKVTRMPERDKRMGGEVYVGHHPVKQMDYDFIVVGTRV